MPAAALAVRVTSALTQLGDQRLHSLTLRFQGFAAVEAEAAIPKAACGQQRQQFSKPVLAKIEGLLLQHLHGGTPGSLLGKALHYLSSQ